LLLRLPFLFVIPEGDLLFPHWPQHPFSTEIFQKSGMFPAPVKHQSKHHNLPAILHKFTTKNHHETTRFLKNPVKKHPSTTPEKNEQNYFITFTGTPSGILISN
jgi:hypothetical protein